MTADTHVDGLLDSVADGDEIDWAALEAGADPAIRPLLAHLKTVAGVARAGRRTAISPPASAPDPYSSEAVERALPQLLTWAHGRLPQWARSAADTQDLVQDAVMRALPKLESFEPGHPAALQAYLRRAVQNRIYDEVQRVRSRRGLTERPSQTARPPIEEVDGEEIERYERALRTLAPADHDAIVGRIERRQSYAEVAIALGLPNADAARLTVRRALARLIEAMQHDR